MEECWFCMRNEFGNDGALDCNLYQCVRDLINRYLDMCMCRDTCAKHPTLWAMEVSLVLMACRNLAWRWLAESTRASAKFSLISREAKEQEVIIYLGIVIVPASSR